MNVKADAVPGSPDPSTVTPSAMAKTRPFHWSLRRELWENRSIVLAPSIAAAVVSFAFLISLAYLPRRVGPLEFADALSKPFEFAAIAVLATSIIVAVFYCLGALHNERRDRSILFWKSLPVSDATTVLAKATIPIVVLPTVVFATVVITHLVMLIASIAVLSVQGVAVATLWARLPLIQIDLVLAYFLVVHAFWLAPIYGWLLLVSGWARRAPFLWAALAPLGLCIVEKIAFGTGHVAALIGYRLIGGFEEAFADTAGSRLSIEPLAHIDPMRFVTSPGLWIGLVVAGAFIAAAVWLRRYREPI